MCDPLLQWVLIILQLILCRYFNQAATILILMELLWYFKRLNRSKRNEK